MPALREQLAVVRRASARRGSSGGGNVLASPGGMNDADTIHSSGNSVSAASDQQQRR